MPAALPPQQGAGGRHVKKYIFKSVGGKHGVTEQFESAPGGAAGAAAAPSAGQPAIPGAGAAVVVTVP